MNRQFNYIHKDLANGRWFDLSLIEQMANIGSEVGRTIKWKNKGSQKSSSLALDRALELSDLTIDDPKNVDSLKEITRMREVLVDYFLGDNIYGSSDDNMDKYFYAFGVAARINK